MKSAILSLTLPRILSALWSKPVISLALRVGAVGIGFLVNLVISRSLGASGGGSYFIAVAVVGLVALLARMGQETLLVREISAEIARGQSGNARKLLHRGLAVSLTGALLGMAAIVALAQPLAEQVFGQPHLAPLFQIMSLVVVLMTVQNVAAESLRGAGWVNASQFLVLVLAPLATLIVIWVLPRPLSVTAVCWSATGGFGLAAVTAAMMSRRVLPPAQGAALPDVFSTRAQLLKGWPLCTAALLTYMSSWADTLVLGTLLPPDMVGVYTIAARIAALCGVVKVSLGAVVAPRLAAAYARGDMEEFRRAGLRYGRMAALGGIPVLAVCFLLAEPLLSLFGEEFTDGVWTLRVLLLGYLATYFLGYGGVALTMTQYAKDMARSLFFGLLCSVVLLYFLVPAHGGIGAGLAMATGTIVMNVIAGMKCAKRLRVRIDLFANVPKYDAV